MNTTPGPPEPLRSLCPQVTSAGDRPAAPQLRVSSPEKFNCRRNPHVPPDQPTQPLPKPSHPALGTCLIHPAEMASTRTLQTAAKALRLGAYRTGVASSRSLLRSSTAPRAVWLSAPAPRHAAAALPSGIRRYSQKQPGESKIWSFEDVRCALAPRRPSHPANPGYNGDKTGRQTLKEEQKATRTDTQTDRMADELQLPAHRSRNSPKTRNPTL